MAENDGAKTPAGGDAVLRRQRSARFGLGSSFIPLGFGILGCVLAWQLYRGGDRRHSTPAGALALGGIMIWLTYNWPAIRHFLAG